MPLLKSIYQYPVKGLSGQPLASINLIEGKPLANDRRFALARRSGPVKADDPQWAKKGSFLMLMLEEELARVKTHLDPETLKFEVASGNETVLAVNLNDAGANAAVEEFFHRLVPALPARPVLVRSNEGHFMDKPDNVISIINLASLQSLEKEWGAQIDPLRFRANLYVDTGTPWEEFDWVGSDIVIGDVTFRVDRRNGRCGATNVNPATGLRDMDIPRSLRASFGHKELGVYLLVTRGGTVTLGDTLVPPKATNALLTRANNTSVGAGERFMCRGCYYIYAMDAGLPAAGIPPGTKPQDFPDMYRCPDCGTDKRKLRPYTS